MELIVFPCLSLCLSVCRLISSSCLSSVKWTNWLIDGLTDATGHQSPTSAAQFNDANRSHQAAAWESPNSSRLAAGKVNLVRHCVIIQVSRNSFSWTKWLQILASRKLFVKQCKVFFRANNSVNCNCDAAWKLNCSSVLTTDTAPVKRRYCCVTHFHFPAAFCCGCNLEVYRL